MVTAAAAADICSVIGCPVIALYLRISAAAVMGLH